MMIVSDCVEVADLDIPRVLLGTCLLGRNAKGVAAALEVDVLGKPVSVVMNQMGGKKL